MRKNGTQQNPRKPSDSQLNKVPEAGRRTLKRRAGDLHRKLTGSAARIPEGWKGPFGLTAARGPSVPPLHLLHMGTEQWAASHLKDSGCLDPHNGHRSNAYKGQTGAHRSAATLTGEHT